MPSLAVIYGRSSPRDTSPILSPGPGWELGRSPNGTLTSPLLLLGGAAPPQTPSVCVGWEYWKKFLEMSKTQYLPSS